MLIANKSFFNFEPWTNNAIATWNRIKEEGKLDEFEEFIDECYPEGINEEKLNDLLRFDYGYIYSVLNIGFDNDDN